MIFSVWPIKFLARHLKSAWVSWEIRWNKRIEVPFSFQMIISFGISRPFFFHTTVAGGFAIDLHSISFSVSFNTINISSIFGPSITGADDPKYTKTLKLYSMDLLMMKLLLRTSSFIVLLTQDVELYTGAKQINSAIFQFRITSTFRNPCTWISSMYSIAIQKNND